MVLAKSYINVAHDDTHLTKYSHMGSNYVLFQGKAIHQHYPMQCAGIKLMTSSVIGTDEIDTC